MDEKKRVLIKGIRFVSEEGFTSPDGALLIEGKRIKTVYPGKIETYPFADEIIEGKGRICVPGVVDDQVHFRDPGLTHKGDIASESAAALLGGVTSWMEMPNTMPQTTTPEAWREKMELGEKKARGNYSFYFGGTNENSDFLPKLDTRHIPGVKVFMGSSTGNMLVDSDEALTRLFEKSPLLVALHSESEEIIRSNRAKYETLYGEDPAVAYHPLIRSREACLESTKRAVRLAEKAHARIHILHLSTEEEVNFLRDGHYPFVTSEVCVHHLWFTDQDYASKGTLIKWNPAIKELHDREALRNGLKDGTLDIVATDHAPHLLEEKRGGAFKAASGGPLAQFSLLVMLELAHEGVFTYHEVIEWMSRKPCALFDVRERGEIKEGYFADLVLIDDRNTLTVTPEIIRSKCGWSPFEGVTFSHRITDVILNGAHVVRDGEIDEELALRSKMALEFNH